MQGLHSTPNIADIYNKLESDAKNLLIFDIDDVLTHSTQHLGRDKWFYDHAVKTGDFEGTLELYLQVQKITTFDLIDPRTPRLFARWREEFGDNLIIIALTARSFALAEPTAKRLADLGIVFDQNFLEDGEYMLFGDSSNPLNIKIQQGIIFCDGKHKGQCLELAFAANRMTPETIFQKVIFIDDKEENVHKVITALKKYHFEPHNIHGIHYTLATNHHHIIQEAKSRPFRMFDIAKEQERVFKDTGQLISDQEAKDKLLQSSPSEPERASY